MAPLPIAFDAPDLAARIEKLTTAERDALPFGVVELDREGRVLFYSATQARLARYAVPKGAIFFAASRSPNRGELEARVRRAMETGPVDIDFAWIGGLSKRELQIRVMSSIRGGVWLFVAADDGKPA
ncbi:MAG: hypothetical protein JO237_01430 [Pseudolabrys sp.]|nr:hypothetical protein [Pseudolabrys sp.]